MKLFLVHTNKFHVYVVASDPTEAENILTKWLANENYGYLSDRVVTKIDVIADTKSKPDSLIYTTNMLLGKIEGK